MHGLQALHRLQVEVLTAHRQVPALDQGQAQVARQVGLLEPGLAVGPRRQEHDAGRVTTGGLARGSLQRIQQPLVAASDVLHPHLPKDVGKLRRDQQAVVQHIPQTRRPLGPLGDDPPATIGPAGDIKGHDQESLATRGSRPVHGAHIARMAQQQGGRQEALMQELPRPIEVRQYRLQQLGALHETGLDFRPVLRLDQERQQFQRPGARRHAIGAEDVMGNPIPLNLLMDLGQAAVQVRRRAATRRRGGQQAQES